METLFASWFVASTLGVPTLLYLCCRSFGRGELARSRAFGIALLVLLWAHPVPQQMLATGPTRELAARIEPYVGAPLAQVVTEFGEPRNRRAHDPYYTARPWYAPFAPPDRPAVQVICFEPGVVGHVYFDD